MNKITNEFVDKFLKQLVENSRNIDQRLEEEIIGRNKFLEAKVILIKDFLDKFTGPAYQSKLPKELKGIITEASALNLELNIRKEKMTVFEKELKIIGLIEYFNILINKIAKNYDIKIDNETIERKELLEKRIKNFGENLELKELIGDKRNIKKQMEILNKMEESNLLIKSGNIFTGNRIINSEQLNERNEKYFGKLTTECKKCKGELEIIRTKIFCVECGIENNIRNPKKIRQKILLKIARRFLN